MKPEGAGPARAQAPLIAAGAAVAGCLAVSVAAWPAFTLLVLLAALVLVLARTSPAAAFVVALGLLGAEGTIKALLTDGETPLPFSPHAVGAATIDLALAAATIGLVVDRGDELGRLWLGAGRLGRFSIACLGAWLALSVLQIGQSGDLVQGAAGFRLTQAYALAAVAGALFLSRPGERADRLLLTVLAAVASYAALRALVGPSELERGFALTRPQGAPEYGEVFRTVGSFSSAVALASFLVPAAVFGFGCALLDTERRALGTVLFAAAGVGAIGSYTRVALVAIAAGVVVAGGFALAGALGSRRRRLAALGIVAAVLALGAGATALAARASPEVRDRARAFLHPLDDPSVRQRLDTWRDAGRDVLREPLGTGLGTVGRASGSGERAVTTDNSYLKVFREQGILVGALFLLGILAALAALGRGVLRAPPNARVLGMAALTGSAAFLVLAAAGEYVEQPGKVLLWTFLGLAGGVAWTRT